MTSKISSAHCRIGVLSRRVEALFVPTWRITDRIRDSQGSHSCKRWSYNFLRFQIPIRLRPGKMIFGPRGYEFWSTQSFGGGYHVTHMHADWFLINPTFPTKFIITWSLSEFGFWSSSSNFKVEQNPNSNNFKSHDHRTVLGPPWIIRTGPRSELGTVREWSRGRKFRSESRIDQKSNDLHMRHIMWLTS